MGLAQDGDLRGCRGRRGPGNRAGRRAAATPIAAMIAMEDRRCGAPAQMALST